MNLKELQLIDNSDVRKIIRDNREEDPLKFALRYNRKKEFPVRAIAEQIKCYQKAKRKLPLLSNSDFIFESVSLEQASSEATAKFKAGIINGKTLIDLTGGLGIDSIHFAAKFEKVVYCEENSLLYELFLRNFKTLGINNIEAFEEDGAEILDSYPDKYFNWVYVDPSRRDSNKRLVGLENCWPNVIANLDLYLQKSENILIKASPALDYKKVKEQLPLLNRFVAVSVDGECKEILLFTTAQEGLCVTSIEAAVLDGEGSLTFHLSKSEIDVIEKKISKEVRQYFYEPDAAIIKTGLSPKVAAQNELWFINHSIDYITADEFIPAFPGRSFQVVLSSVYNKRKMKEYLSSNGIISANIARRDFPDSPEEIRSNLKLKDGGKDYLFFTKNSVNDLIFIHCKKPEI